MARPPLVVVLALPDVSARQISSIHPDPGASASRGVGGARGGRGNGSEEPDQTTVWSFGAEWRKRVGVEPTRPGRAATPTDLKSARATGPHALPRRIMSGDSAPG